jgi:hypothetical protein
MLARCFVDPLYSLVVRLINKLTCGSLAEDDPLNLCRSFLNELVAMEARMARTFASRLPGLLFRARRTGRGSVLAHARSTVSRHFQAGKETTSPCCGYTFSYWRIALVGRRPRRMCGIYRLPTASANRPDPPARISNEHPLRAASSKPSETNANESLSRPSSVNHPSGAMHMSKHCGRLSVGSAWICCFQPSREKIGIAFS